MTPAAIEDALRAFFEASAEDVVACWLFGSVARGEARPESDVDVAVLYRGARSPGLDGLPLDLEAALERCLARPVQVIDLGRAPPDLVHRVLRDGKLVCERERAARVRFEVMARNEYFDVLPHLQRYRRTGELRRMTDPELCAKKLAFIETCLRELRTLARPELIATDVRELRFVEHTLQLAIQAALDVASHVVSDERLGEPSTNRELFDLLARHGWLEAELATRLRRMAGFRNILVHGYAEVDPAIVEDVLVHHLTDVDQFVAAMRSRLLP